MLALPFRLFSAKLLSNVFRSNSHAFSGLPTSFTAALPIPTTLAAFFKLACAPHVHTSTPPSPCGKPDSATEYAGSPTKRRTAWSRAQSRPRMLEDVAPVVKVRPVKWEAGRSRRERTNDNARCSMYVQMVSSCKTPNLSAEYVKQ